MKNKKVFLILLIVFIFLFCFQAFAQEAGTLTSFGKEAGTTKVVQQLVMSPKEFIFGTIQFLCMGLIVYFLMVINPAKTSEEAHQQFIENLKKNDEVSTTAGLFGKVASISPDSISLEIAANTKVRFDPKHIQPLPKAPTKAK